MADKSAIALSHEQTLVQNKQLQAKLAVQWKELQPLQADLMNWHLPRRGMLNKPQYFLPVGHVTNLFDNLSFLGDAVINRGICEYYYGAVASVLNVTSDIE